MAFPYLDCLEQLRHNMFAEVTSDMANSIGEQKEALLQRLSQRITQDAQHGLGTVTAYSPISTRDAQENKA